MVITLLSRRPQLSDDHSNRGTSLMIVIARISREWAATGGRSQVRAAGRTDASRYQTGAGPKNRLGGHGVCRGDY